MEKNVRLDSHFSEPSRRQPHLLLKPLNDLLPDGSISLGLDPIEKSRMALTKLFLPDYKTNGIPAFKGLSDAYVHFTGDIYGDGIIKKDKIATDLRACQDFNSGSFISALQYSMNVFIAKSYKEFPFHEEILISQKHKAIDFKKMRSIQFGYFNELSETDPEAEDYSDIAPYDEEKTESDFKQHGVIIWVTRMLILNDSIGIIKAMLQRLSRAARQTHAKYVWKFFTQNALCPDGTAWFTPAHGNLGNSALDILPLVTAITALANMTEPGSGEKIGIDLPSFNWSLVAPIGLWDTAVKKNQCDSTYTVNDLTTKEPNPCMKLFGEKNERIITCPFLTDVNDWGVIRDKEDVPIVEMTYYDGKEDPEIITTNNVEPLGNRAFVGDQIGFKARHEYCGCLVDYRNAYKSIVA